MSIRRAVLLLSVAVLLVGGCATRGQPSCAPEPPALTGLTHMRKGESGLHEYSLDKDPTVELVLIPEGSFTMGAVPGDEDARDNEKPAHRVRLSAYLVSKNEITWAQFRRMTDEWEFRVPRAPRWAGDDSQLADFPVVNVSVQDVLDYCQWAELRLPTEAEWERAARGGREGQKYPWGDEWDGAKANGKYEGENRVVAVGSYPPNAFGLFDMTGNVFEWVSDRYIVDHYGESPRSNPLGPPAGRGTARGGARGWAATQQRISYRFADTAEARHEGVGFRVARTAK